MKKLLLFCTFVGLIFGMQSCVSTSSFQTARVTETGEYGYGAGITLPRYTFEEEITDTIFGSNSQSVNGFAGEIYARYGVMENLDVGLKVAVIGSSGIDAKYQFLGDSESMLAGSVGLGLSYLSINGGGNDATSYRTFDLTVPLYFSIHPTDWFSFYLSPRYLYRASSNNASFYGGIGGVRVGKRTAGFIEYALMANNSDLWGTHRQLNIGIGIGIN